MAPGLGGPLAGVTGRLARLIRTVGDRLFRDADTRASEYGWLITTRRGGLARTYRDPRFDRFRRCPVCRGTGIRHADQACQQCAGTGRITVVQPVLSDRRPGR